ncbi:MAG: antiterminator LoaP [Spirochaetales bacterium]|nr:antiterminator LoaP [Spirochaetales bacterium]MCF7937083.1 antiterminator LoaP [Spirochaetales bacterium]
MNFYVVQVKSRNEDKFLKMIAYNNPELRLKFFWPRRSLTIWKQGKPKETLKPIFPGYLFLETEEVSADIYWLLKRMPDFYRFLKSNYDIVPLEGDDKRLVLHFQSYGEIAEKSQVVFDENQRIQVLDGPLKGLEGRIVKVDKRKKRAKVKLSLYDDAFLIDFGFEDMEAMKNDREELPESNHR